MKARPHRGAFAAFPKQNNKCRWETGTLGTLGIDRAIKIEN